jgi:hypothetical protein
MVKVKAFILKRDKSGRHRGAGNEVTDAVGIVQRKNTRLIS